MTTRDDPAAEPLAALIEQHRPLYLAALKALAARQGAYAKLEQYGAPRRCEIKYGPDVIRTHADVDAWFERRLAVGDIEEASPTREYMRRNQADLHEELQKLFDNHTAVGLPGLAEAATAAWEAVDPLTMRILRAPIRSWADAVAKLQFSALLALEANGVDEAPEDRPFEAQAALQVAEFLRPLGAVECATSSIAADPVVALGATWDKAQAELEATAAAGEEDRWNEVSETIWLPTSAAIAATPATSYAGLAVKLRLLQLDIEHGYTASTHDLVAGALADAERLALPVQPARATAGPEPLTDLYGEWKRARAEYVAALTAQGSAEGAVFAAKREGTSDEPALERAFAEAKKVADAACHRAWTLVSYIRLVQPSTIEGVLVKLRLAADHIREDHPNSSEPKNPIDRLILRAGNDAERFAAVIAPAAAPPRTRRARQSVSAIAAE